MTSPYARQDDGGTGRKRLRVDAGRLWMGGLATALVAALVGLGGVPVAMLAPFATAAELDTKVATAAISLAVGIAIGSLIPRVARSATRLGRERPAGP